VNITVRACKRSTIRAHVAPCEQNVNEKWLGEGIYFTRPSPTDTMQIVGARNPESLLVLLGKIF